ncbi:MAG: outer membrane lipoprotein carrier protein LolA, partial [Calditrichaeota bacterium]
MKNQFSLQKYAIFVLSILFALTTQSFAGEDVDDVVKDLKKRYEKFKTLQATFTQTTIWSLAGDEQRVNGKFYASGKNKYRVETDVQIIVTDGKTVWTYSKDRNQVVINALDGAGKNKTPRDLLIKYTNDFNAKLDGDKIFHGRKCHEVVFTPRNEDAFVVQTRVLVDKKNQFALRIEQE